MKKYIFFAAMFAMIFTATGKAQTWQIGYPIASNVTATLNNDTLTISGMGMMKSFLQNDIPWYNVKNNIKSVVINNGVTSIGQSAFWEHNNITSVTFPESITSIGYCAFYSCIALASITIPKGVTDIKGWAFANCIELSTVIIPQSITNIEDMAFAYCTGLTDITVNWNTPLSINSDVFYQVDITEIILHVPSGIENLYAATPFWKDFNINKTNAEPLLKTKWNQDAPYWDLCPMDGSHRSYTGCVATAMAQIMNYYKHPTTRTSEIPAYTTRTNKFSIPTIIGTTDYNWENMLNSYSSSSTDLQKNAVATLMYHCGVSLEMDYTSYASGAYSSNVVRALRTYFGYKQSISHRIRNDYDDTSWHTILRTELDAGRPVYYSGYDENFGHAFVCDGYKKNNNYFHFNWGWGGLCDGWFLTSLLNPGTGGAGAGNGIYNYKQGIIINIEPDDIKSDNENVVIWTIGTPNPNDVTATFDKNNGTLTIGGKGAMKDFNTVPYHITNIIVNAGITTKITGAMRDSCSAPWYDMRNHITKVIINADITNIGEKSFYNCTALTDMTVNWKTPLSVASNIFSGVPVSNVNLYVPKGMRCTYATAPVWQDFNINSPDNSVSGLDINSISSDTDKVSTLSQWFEITLTELRNRTASDMPIRVGYALYDRNGCTEIGYAPAKIIDDNFIPGWGKAEYSRSIRLSDFGLISIPEKGTYRIYPVNSENLSFPYRPYAIIKGYGNLDKYVTINISE
jgi:hypothetical protein